jgi:FixJ family two-component response regulator
MPRGISGRDLAAWLRERKPDLRVIFTSGYTAEIAGRQLTLRPGENFLQKPTAPADVLVAVRRALDT